MTHPYAGPLAFKRIMLLIATFVKYPGVGYINCIDSKGEHNSLAEVQTYLRKTADDLGLDLPAYSPHTIQSDLKTLRKYDILESHRYRWGYYLGTGVMNKHELKKVFHAVRSQAKYQGEPSTIELYEKLKRRIRDVGAKQREVYPVRTQLERAIVYTNPVEMMEKQAYRDTLFEKIDQVEEAILEGIPIELFRCKSPNNPQAKGFRKAFPLQLVYSDIAWYLLQEDYATGHIFTSRIDRYTGHLKRVEQKGRGHDHQFNQLRIAHRLLAKGWGMNLGGRNEQAQEIKGTINLVEIRVRFFGKAAGFILEGEKRHPTQRIERGHKDKRGQLSYADYIVNLPARSINEFYHWVGKFSGSAQIICPKDLAERHQTDARSLLARYSVSEEACADAS